MSEVPLYLPRNEEDMATKITTHVGHVCSNFRCRMIERKIIVPGLG